VSPWKNRLRFVRDAQSDRFKMSELCARYGVSRHVGYGGARRVQDAARVKLQIEQARDPADHYSGARIVRTSRYLVLS
jgi:hypothetical protein